MTFDYNYVRVFGAAAKKCVCGSSLCRGYIGGDPSNADVIVQGDSDDEYLEPVISSEDVRDDLGNIVSATSSIDVTKKRILGKDVHQLENVIEHLDVTKGMHGPEKISLERKETDMVAIPGIMETSENEDYKQRSSSAELESLVETDKLGLSQSMQTLETLLQPDDVKGELKSGTHQVSPVAEEMCKSLSAIESSETSCSTRTLSKSISDVADTNRKSKNDTEEDKNVVSTSPPIMKSSRSSASVKKGKSKKKDVQKTAEIVNKLHQAPHKSKKSVEVSSNDPFEAGMQFLLLFNIYIYIYGALNCGLTLFPMLSVEAKLNELLDADGGISKRKVSIFLIIIACSRFRVLFFSFMIS